MTLSQDLDKWLAAQAAPTDGTVQPESTVDAAIALHALAGTREWTFGHIETLDFLSRQIDIGGPLYRAYGSSTGKTATNERLDTPNLQLATAVLWKAAMTPTYCGDRQSSLKRFNVLFKALDIACSPLLDSASARQELEARFRALVDAPPDMEPLANTSDSPATLPAGNRDREMTVLFSEGPIARAYLETMAGLSIRPRKIIRIVRTKDIGTGKTLGGWMPSELRKSYCSFTEYRKIHYWPARIAKEHADAIGSIRDRLEAIYGVNGTTFANAQNGRDLRDYCDDVETVLCDGLRDGRLEACLAGQPAGAILYTGGGIVPKRLLSIPHLRFVHVHPGYLPHIRGADCALWSELIAGRAAATAFFMAPGIDTGDIIHAAWLPELRLASLVEPLELKNAYRTVFGFVDPWIRATVLRQTLETRPSLFESPSRPQRTSDGTTFHFMHSRLIDATLGQQPLY